jgi:hypothetical protein
MFCGLPLFGRPCNKDKGKIVEHDDPIRRCRITDALEFYASVREAAKRRVDAAETHCPSFSDITKAKRKNQPKKKRYVILKRYSTASMTANW